MLLFFFFNFSALVSLFDRSPQKLFLAFIGACPACGFGRPLLKKLLTLAVGRWGPAEDAGCVGTGAGRCCGRDGPDCGAWN